MATNRRRFLQTSGLGAAGLMAAPAGASSAAGKLDANDRVRVAVVGIRGQGANHLRQYNALEKVEVAAVCEVDDRITAERMKELEEAGVKPKVYKDIRKLLEDQSIDAVSIATPNHWHSLMGVWACQAGKDVYVEKPCSHTAWEGRQLVKAARKYDRIVQHGTNSRSGPAIREGVQQLNDGLIGDVYMARGLCFKWRDTIGRTPKEPVPEGVDYNLWLGPAPQRPFSRNRFHYNWHWHWDYGNGDLGNQGVHQMDVARWGLGVRLPTKVHASGGHFMFDDDQETPNTLTATFEFQDGDKKKILVFEVRHWISNHEAGLGVPHASTNTIGNIFYGSKGYLEIGVFDYYRSRLGREQRPGPMQYEEGNNWANFIAAVRSRKREDLNAEIEEGHLSSLLIHIANISYRLGRSLDFDPETERFVNDEEANRMLRRDYRAPFAVPEKV